MRDVVEKFLDIHFYHDTPVFSQADFLVQASDRLVGIPFWSKAEAVSVEDWLIDGFEDFGAQVLYDFVLEASYRERSRSAGWLWNEFLARGFGPPFAVLNLAFQVFNIALEALPVLFLCDLVDSARLCSIELAECLPQIELVQVMHQMREPVGRSL
jgi:hypothetical protein